MSDTMTSSFTIEREGQVYQFGFNQCETTTGYEVWVRQSDRIARIAWIYERYRSHALYRWIESQPHDFLVLCCKEDQTALKRLLLARSIVAELDYRFSR